MNISVIFQNATTPSLRAVAKQSSNVASFKATCWIALVLFACAPTLSAQTPFHFETSQHVPVLFLPTKSVPMLTVHVGFHAGSAYDGPLYGLSALTTALLNQGYDHLDANQVADAVADTGALYAAGSSRDLVDISINTLTTPQAFSQAMLVFSHIIAHPNFLDTNVTQQKKQQLALLRYERESPERVAMDAFFKALYADHPYGHPIHGTEKTIDAIKRDDILRFYHQYFVRENAVMVMVGDIDLIKAKQLAEQLFALVPSGQKAAPVPQAKRLKQTQQTIPFSASQTTYVLGQLGINHHSPAYFPLMVGNYSLGGATLNSQLGVNLREKHGMTYGVTSAFEPMSGIGPFFIHFSTQRANAGEALKLTKQVTAAFLKQGPTEDELAAAKAYLIGSFPLSLASNTSLASMLLKIVFYQLPYDFLDTYVANLRAVDVAAIRQAFQSTLLMDDMVTISVGAEK